MWVMRRPPYVLIVATSIALLIGVMTSVGSPTPLTRLDDNTGGDLPIPTAPGGWPGEAVAAAQR